MTSLGELHLGTKAKPPEAETFPLHKYAWLLPATKSSRKTNYKWDEHKIRTHY